MTDWAKIELGLRRCFFDEHFITPKTTRNEIQSELNACKEAASLARKELPNASAVVATRLRKELIKVDAHIGMLRQELQRRVHPPQKLSTAT